MKTWECTIGWRPQGSMSTHTGTLEVQAPCRITARSEARLIWENLKKPGDQYLWTTTEEVTDQLTLKL